MKIACVQVDAAFGDPPANVQAALDHLEWLAARDTQLAVFPEAFLTGYCVASRDQALEIAIDRDHPAIAELAVSAERLGITVVVGFAERLPGDRLANSAALLEPGHEPRFYRKVHLPCLGLDNHVEAGDDLPVFETRLGRIGILICFDLRAPEAARSLALRGAELIVVPTNWPVGAGVSADHIAIARAAENRVFVATCNRTGDENGFEFIGRSKIVDPLGQVLASAGAGSEVIEADVDLGQARKKRTVTIPGKYETEVFASRRPELYGELTRPKP